MVELNVPVRIRKWYVMSLFTTEAHGLWRCAGAASNRRGSWLRQQPDQLTSALRSAPSMPHHQATDGTGLLVFWSDRL